MVAITAPGWELQFRLGKVMQTARAARRADRGIAVGNLSSDLVQLHRWDVDTGALVPLTDSRVGVYFGNISPDGAHVYYFRDESGSERGHYVQVPYEGGPVTSLTPDMPPYATIPGMSVSDLSRDGSRFAFTAADASLFACYAVELPGGHPGPVRQVFTSQSLTFGPLLAADGRLGVVMSAQRSGRWRFSLCALDLASAEHLGELWEDEASLEATVLSPAPGDYRVAATSDATGFRRPFLWDVRTGERVELCPSPDPPGDLIPMDWSPDAAELLLVQVFQARHQLMLLDLRTHRIRALDHRGGTLFRLAAGVYFGPSGSVHTTWQNSAHPGELLELDRFGARPPRTLLRGTDFVAAHQWQSVQFTSSDRQDVQGWLAKPEGSGPFPTILDMHGGPHSVTTEYFSAIAQSWISEGFAWCSINYRGSTTFGREFREQITGDIGHWELADVIAARQYLVDLGVADPGCVLLTGSSYGGYLTLWGMVRSPGLWAGGMAWVAIADWAALYEDASGFLRGACRAMFGGSPDEVPDRYRLSSPISYVDALAAPLLIIQGENDSRCPPRQMKAFVAAARQLGKRLDIEWFTAGHGHSTQVKQAIRDQHRMLRFAREIAGARRRVLP